MLGLFYLSTILVIVNSCRDVCTNHECSNEMTCKIKFVELECLDPPCQQGSVFPICINAGEDAVNPCKSGSAFLNEEKLPLNCSSQDSTCPHGSVCESDPEIGWNLCCSRCYNPGDCPIIPEKANKPNLCIKECEMDSDCGAITKCCFNGCGQSCLDAHYHDN